MLPSSSPSSSASAPTRTYLTSSFGSTVLDDSLPGKVCRIHIDRPHGDVMDTVTKAGEGAGWSSINTGSMIVVRPSRQVWSFMSPDPGSGGSELAAVESYYCSS